MKRFNVYSKTTFINILFEKEKPGVYGFLNPYSCLVVPDLNIIYGVDSFYLANFFLSIENISFDNTSFAPIFFQFANDNYKNILFIGASQDENMNFITLLKKKYKNLNCDGINGYENFNFYDNLLKKKEYNFVIIGTGSPLQETLANDLFLSNKRIKFITCGGYIRQASKGLNYFPPFFSILKIRFLYRFFKEPHVFKRTIRTYFKFYNYFIYGRIKFNIFK